MDTANVFFFILLLYKTIFSKTKEVDSKSFIAQNFMNKKVLEVNYAEFKHIHNIMTGYNELPFSVVREPSNMIEAKRFF